MSILRALQKKQIEQMPVGEADVKIEVSTNVVPFDKNSRRLSTPPEVFTDNNFKIGNTEFGVRWAVGFFNRDGTP